MSSLYTALPEDDRCNKESLENKTLSQPSSVSNPKGCLHQQSPGPKSSPHNSTSHRGTEHPSQAPTAGDQAPFPGFLCLGWWLVGLGAGDHVKHSQSLSCTIPSAFLLFSKDTASIPSAPPSFGFPIPFWKWSLCLLWQSLDLSIRHSPTAWVLMFPPIASGPVFTLLRKQTKDHGIIWFILKILRIGTCSFTPFIVMWGDSVHGFTGPLCGRCALWDWGGLMKKPHGPGSKHRDTDMQHHGQGWKTPQRKSSFKHDTESRSWRCRPGILGRSLRWEDCKVKASLGKWDPFPHSSSKGDEER